jgi:DNA excision repair protein ERCC-3
VREDGKEDEVFCLIGPSRYDVPWRVLESAGLHREAHLHRDPRAPRPTSAKERYAARRPARAKFRLASENPAKFRVVERLDRKHRERPGARHRPVPRPARGARRDHLKTRR